MRARGSAARDPGEGDPAGDPGQVDDEAAPAPSGGTGSDREKLIEELHAEREANVKAAAEAAQEAEAAAWLEAKRTSEDGGEPGDTGPA